MTSDARSRLATCLLLVALAMAAATPARAQSGEDARSRARALVGQGHELYDAGEYEAALARFDAAYALFPSAKIFFNIGQANRKLGRAADAFAAFERFIAEAPDAPAASRAEAQQAMVELRTRMGWIDVVSDTPGAEVLVDGRPRGITPLRAPLPADGGPHVVVVQMAGASPILVQRVEVVAGQLGRVTATTTPQPAAPVALAPPVAAAMAPPAASAAPPPTLLTAPRTSTDAPDTTGRPIHTRWWLWTAIGVVSVAAATGVVLATRPSEGPLCTCNLAPGVITVSGH